ncbi:MAG: homoserine dehydrogenase [Phycisphaeraceae bacterium]|nr:homoserine dehydrogenase [Phycisphaeraceae bacterium]
MGIGLIGLGTVGGGVGKLLTEQANLFAQRLGRPVELRRVLVRTQDLAAAKASKLVPAALLTDDAEDFFKQDTAIVVELAGGVNPMRQFVSRALESGRHVVTANKSLLAKHGPELFALARKHNVSIAFEASCAGGIPIIYTLQFSLLSNRVHGLYGILNGTCNYILTQMTRHNQPYDTALDAAQKLGYAEADPTLDVSGADAAQKLSILASLAFGTRIVGEQVPCEGIDKLELADIGFGKEMGYDVKLLGIAERGDDGKVSVGVRPCFLRADDLLADVTGPFNAISVLSDALGHSLYYGAGAGRMPTASAVVSDILNIASGWYPQAFAQLRLTPDLHEPAALLPAEQLVSRFYLRVNAMDLPGTMAQVTTALAEHEISISAVMQHERNEGQHVPVVVITHEVAQGDLNAAMAKIAGLDCIAGRPVVIRIVDLPH